MAYNYVILITGLSGSGKTTLAKKLVDELGATHFNADDIRGEYDDWDFTPSGRSRQLLRMFTRKNSTPGIVILDFICPRETGRIYLNADLTIFMDTVASSKYVDTDSLYERPENPDIHVKSWNEDTVTKVRKIIDRCADIDEA